MSKNKRVTSQGTGAPSMADRKHERVPLRREAVVTLFDAALQPVNQWACGVKDLSASGACLLLADMPTEGDRLVVSIAPSSQNRGAVFFAKVVHIGMVEGEWIRVGVQFLQAPPELQPLVDALHEDMLRRLGLPVRAKPSDAAADEKLDSLGRPHRRSA